MPRWTPIVYINCTRCAGRHCVVSRRIEARFRDGDGTPIPVVVRSGRGAGSAEAAASGAAAGGPASPALQARAARSPLREIGQALPFVLLGLATLLIASFEGRSR